MNQVLIIKVTLQHRRPLTWRRLAVPLTVTYAQLHEILQLAFDWENEHLFAFYPSWNRQRSYELPSPDALGEVVDARTAMLITDLKQGSVQYVYDFGEGWTHEISLDRAEVITGQLPQCLAGRGAGFYEDGLGSRLDRFDRERVSFELQQWGNDQGWPPIPAAPLTAGAGPHAMHVNGKQWRQATATRVHRDAVKAAQLTASEALPSAPAAVLVAALVNFTDKLYATSLQTPQQWTNQAVVKQLIAQLTPLPTVARVQYGQWLSQYFAVLSQTTSMTRKRALALQNLVTQQLATLKRPQGTTGAGSGNNKLLRFPPRP